MKFITEHPYLTALIVIAIIALIIYFATKSKKKEVTGVVPPPPPPPHQEPTERTTTNLPEVFRAGSLMIPPTAAPSTGSGARTSNLKNG